VSLITSGVDTTKELVSAAVDGDLYAREELVRRYAGVVWATVRRFRLCEADAQDAVQSTWMLMIEHLGSLRDPDRLPGWLATTARRECLKILRQSRRDGAGVEPDAAERAEDRSPTPERFAVDHAMHNMLWKYVAELPPRGRHLLLALVTSDSPRYAEFARLTGMPIGSIGPTRMRYLHNLRRRLEQAGLGAEAWR
jgi:RNA polymerase sigma factor (sigma-70 family)